MRLRVRRMVLGATGFDSVCGGIAANNRNLLDALTELALEHQISLSVLALLEPRRLGRGRSCSPFTGFSGSKRRFTQRLVGSWSPTSLFVFDHVGLGQPLLPLVLSRVARTVILAHGSEAWRRIRRRSRWSFGAATLTLTNSAYTLSKMREVLPGLRGAACPLGLPAGVRLNRSIPRGQLPVREMTAADGAVRPLGDRLILLVGRMDSREREKGHRELIEALPRLKARFPSVQLAFPGPGDDRQSLARLARARGVGGSVFLPGWLPTDELNELYRRCFTYAAPSLQEGFGLAYLEAMNFGKSCIGCRDQGAEEVIADRETGFLVRDPGDVEELAGCLERLLADPAQTRQMGERGFARLHRHFTAVHYKERIKALIGPLL